MSVLPVVPAALINELSKNLNWRLCSVRLWPGHIHVINEDDSSDAKPAWTKFVFNSLLKTKIYDILNLVAVSLGRKSNFNRLVLFFIELISQDS